MDIKEISLGGLGSVFEGTTSSGFSVSVFPMEGKRTARAVFGAKIGSLDRGFTSGGRHVSAPAGVAHFLEHKLFESGEGGNAFDLFAKTGAVANAYTSYENTVYLFDTTLEFEKSLEVLLRFVTSPYFTEENVAKERGIIAEEISMYDDSPDWKLSEDLLRCLYPAHPVRDDIAGTAQSISEITPEVLYDCYNAFYRPSEMALCVAGGVEPERVFETAQRVLEGVVPSGGAAVRDPIRDDGGILKDRSERRMPIMSPQFSLGYREKPAGEGRERVMLSQRVKLITELIVGECSGLYRSMYDGGLINDSFYAGDLTVRDAMSVSFSGESLSPERAVEEIKREIERVKREGFSDERFEEVRRAYIGRSICGFDFPSTVASKMLFCRFNNCEMCDIIGCNVTKGELEDAVRGMFRDEFSATAVIVPSEDLRNL